LIAWFTVLFQPFHVRAIDPHKFRYLARFQDGISLFAFDPHDELPLVGIAVVSYIKPTTTGGVFILIAAPLLTCSEVGGIIAFFHGTKRRMKDQGDDDSAAFRT